MHRQYNLLVVTLSLLLVYCFQKISQKNPAKYVNKNQKRKKKRKQKQKTLTKSQLNVKFFFYTTECCQIGFAANIMILFAVNINQSNYDYCCHYMA